MQCGMYILKRPCPILLISLIFGLVNSQVEHVPNSMNVYDLTQAHTSLFRVAIFSRSCHTLTPIFVMTRNEHGSRVQYLNVDAFEFEEAQTREGLREASFNDIEQ